MSIRMLWTYEHPTARLQEMMLFPEIGIEAIPTYTDFQTSWLDNRYHDESHAMYPDWRRHVTLPVNVVEHIRRMKLWERNFVVTDEEADLVNASIDLVFINCSPETLGNLFSWFKGSVLFRCNGGPNSKVLFEDADRWVDVAVAHGAIDRFIYLPSTLKLISDKMARSGAPIINMPVYVDARRIPGSWAGKAERVVATSISYLDFHDHFKGQLATMGRAYGGKPVKLKVFGKNKQKESPAGNVEIIGGLPDENEFWRQILDCDVFVDAGQDPTHNIFPPLEAMAKDMPILFPERNGNVEAVQDAYPHLALDERYGVFPNHTSIVEFIKRTHGNVDKLRAISSAQKSLFLGYFSKANALRAAAEVRDLVLSKVITGKVVHILANAELRAMLDKRPLNQVWKDKADTFETNFQPLVTRAGMASDDGTLTVENLHSNSEEQVLCEFLPDLAPGTYEFHVEYSAVGGDDGAKAGNLEIGRWAGGQDYESEIVPMLSQDKSAVVPFVVTKETALNKHELRLSAFRNIEITFERLLLRRRSVN